MGSYYYYTKDDGELIDSTSPLKGEQYTRLNELQYTIAKLAIAGYLEREVQDATEYVFSLLKERIEG